MEIDSITLIKMNEPLVFPCPDMHKQAGIMWRKAIAIDAEHQASLTNKKTNSPLLENK